MTHNFWDKFTLREKATEIGTAMVETQEVRSIAARLNLALESHRTRPMGNVCVIHGPSFVGKTAACEDFMEVHAEEIGGSFEMYTPTLIDGDEQDHLASVSYVEVPGPRGPRRPIVMINVGAGPTYKGLLRDTIHAITRVMPADRATNNALTNLLAKQLRLLGTELIIFDSAHNLTNNLNTRDQTFAGGLLVSICKQAKIEVAVVGQGPVRDIFQNHPELKELKEQDYEVSALPRPVQTDEGYEKGKEPPFHAFVESLVDHLPFKAQTDLLEFRVLDRLFTYSQGLPGRLSRLFQLGTKYAVAHDAPAVNMNILYLTLRDLVNIPDDENAFLRNHNEPIFKSFPGSFTL